ncbi:MAG: hypothetical protein EOO61_14295, partial [Hymenobacter sp.]
MQTFLRPRRWVVGPPLPAWLSMITRLLQPAALTPALLRATASLALLLGGVAFVPNVAWAQTCPTATTTLSFTDNNANRPTGENWVNHTTTGVPDPAGLTTVYTNALANTNVSSSTLAVGTLNGKTLVWTSDYSTTTGSSAITFYFNRALSNFTLNIQDIDASRSGFLDFDPNFTDQVVITGANGTTSTPLTDISLTALTGATVVAIAANTATGIDDNNANTAATIRASFSSPVTQVTIALIPEQSGVMNGYRGTGWPF